MRASRRSTHWTRRRPSAERLEASALLYHARRRSDGLSAPSVDPDPTGPRGGRSGRGQAHRARSQPCPGLGPAGGPAGHGAGHARTGLRRGGEPPEPRADSRPPWPRPGTLWWWSTQADALARALPPHAAAMTLATVRLTQAAARRSRAHRRAREASDRHLAAAFGLLRLDERLRAEAAAYAATERQVRAALAVLGRRAGVEGRAGPMASRMRLLAAELVGAGQRHRRHSLRLAGERGVRTLELRALAAEVRLRRDDAAAADAWMMASMVRQGGAATEWMEADWRLAAAGRTARGLVAQLDDLSTVTLSPQGSAKLTYVDGNLAGRQRRSDLDRRLDHRLLRLADAATRPPGVERWRRAASRRRGATPHTGTDRDPGPLQAYATSLRLLSPISGDLTRPARTGRAFAEPGCSLLSKVPQTVSAPIGGRVVFAGPFRGRGSLLIIDRGEGYHVLMTGFARLDVREGASVVAGQAIGEIVAQGDEPARLYLELRYRGVPLDPAPRLAAREDKVRS